MPLLFLYAVLPVAAIVLIIRSGSRAACIGVFCSLLVYVLPYIRNSMKKQRHSGKGTKFFAAVAVLAVLLLLYVCFHIYALRPDSADGRVHIWKIAGRLACRHWLAGTGTEKFPGEFLKEQTGYLAIPGNEDAARLLTSGVRYAFNDLLQTACEKGFILLLVIIWLTCQALSCVFRIISSPGNGPAKEGLTCIAAAVTVILVASFFSYPLYTLPMRVMLVVFLAVIAHYSMPDQRWLPYFHLSRCVTRIIMAASIIGSLAFLLFDLLQLREENRFYTLNIYSAMDQPPSEHANALRRLFYLLHGEEYYQRSFADALDKAKDWKGEIAVLEEERRLFPEPERICRLGKLYGLTGDVQREGSMYLLAAQAFPLLLRPSFCLAGFYHQHGDRIRARYYAQKVLSTSPKIINTDAAIMRSYAQALLNLDH